ncbi:hypothetical protein [Acinetobacter venetianus]|uniref:hypothetical protein n=1 Tax=Acinetobacter venetianus TaxID=52133 RepID=UPI00241DB1BF|nr:hypothetical protein [Acinetobacter venetianus]
MRVNKDIKSESDLKSYIDNLGITDSAYITMRKTKSTVESLVGKELTSSTKVEVGVKGVFSLSSVKQSLENSARTVASGLPKNIHYVIANMSQNLFSSAIKVSASKDGKTTYLAAPVPVASQAKVLVAWFKVSEPTGVNRSHNIIEFVKVTPLDPTKPSSYYERDTGEVWIDVSRLQEGDIGSGIYSAVGNYTYNTGKVFIGDPAGLSDAAVVRRTSAMLSLALKFESTRFMEPSVEQRKGDDSKGVASLEWGQSEVENLRHLIDTFVATTYNQFEGLNEYRYDFTEYRYVDRRGRPLDSARLDRGERTANARTAKVGKATIKRAIVLKSLISSQSSERPRILEQFLSRSQSLKARGLEGIFYSQYAFDATEHDELFKFP